jgi:hypothetical protein
VQLKFHLDFDFSCNSLTLDKILSRISSSLLPILLPVLSISDPSLSLLISFPYLIFHPGSARTELSVYVAMAFFSAGACALPMILGFLTDEVSGNVTDAHGGACSSMPSLFHRYCGTIGRELIIERSCSVRSIPHPHSRSPLSLYHNLLPSTPFTSSRFNLFLLSLLSFTPSPSHSHSLPYLFPSLYYPTSHPCPLSLPFTPSPHNSSHCLH